MGEVGGSTRLKQVLRNARPLRWMGTKGEEGGGWVRKGQGGRKDEDEPLRDKPTDHPP